VSVSESRARREVFGRKKYQKTGDWRMLHNEELMVCTHQILLRRSNKKIGVPGMGHKWVREGVRAAFGRQI
jgi:hypothetical protein